MGKVLSIAGSIVVVLLLVSSVVTYNSVGTPSDVSITNDGETYTLSVNSSDFTDVKWSVTPTVNSAGATELTGRSVSLELEPGTYDVKCIVTDAKGGVRTVVDHMAVSGLVMREMDYTYAYAGTTGKDTLTVSFDYAAVAACLASDVPRSVSSVSTIKSFFVVDETMSEIASQLKTNYEKLTGSPVVKDTCGYAQYVLDFTTSTMKYIADKSSRGVSEYWKLPLETLYDKGGDCEDTSIFFSTLMLASGYTAAGVYLLPGHAIACVTIVDDVPVGIGASIVEERNGYSFYGGETTAQGWHIGYTSSAFADAKPQLYVVTV